MTKQPKRPPRTWREAMALMKKRTGAKACVVSSKRMASSTGRLNEYERVGKMIVVKE